MRRWLSPFYLGSALLQVSQAAGADGRAIYNPAEHSAAIANIPSDTTPGSNPSFSVNRPMPTPPAAAGGGAGGFTAQPQNSVTAPAANYSGPMSAPPAASGATSPAGTGTGTDSETGAPAGKIR